MKIVSGGQTGADRAGLDVAIELGMEYGGYIPRGRRTEDGSLPSRYDRIVELETPSYPVRTRKNVLESDATLLFTIGKMSKGTGLTLKIASKAGKPYLHVNLKSVSRAKASGLIKNWLSNTRPGVLNIAGSRESKSPGIYSAVCEVLKNALE